MRNLRKRRKLIRQMEQANKIPDKLMPQEIKDMLDVAGFRPVIENTPNSAEIKINSGRSNALRCLAVVAAFVLVVGGFAVLRFSNTQFVKNTPIPLLHSPLTPQVLTASVERPIRVFTTI